MGKLWKKSIAFLLILTLVLSLANVTEAKAAQTAWKHSGDWVYYVENHGAVIGGYEGTKTKVSIPSKLDGYKVKKLSYYIFAGTKVKSVTVPSSVETIDSDAFGAGTDAEHVPLEGILHTINVSKKNKHYTSVNGVLFSKDKKTLVAYPQGRADTEYKIPSGTETIASFAFENNRKLKKVVFPGSVKNMETWVFARCTRLQEVSLNNGLCHIGCESFQDCENLKEITIPKTVVNMDTRNPMFDGAAKLETIQVHPQNQHYSSKGGVLFDKKMKTMYEYPNGKKAASYTVPAAVETVGGMKYNPYLKEVTLPPSVKTIEDSALQSAISLRKIKMTSHLKKIGESAFRGCRELQAVTIPKGVTSIGDAAFHSCSSLKKIVFKTKDCSFFPNNTVIPEYTVIYGYAKSTAYRYAKNYGRTFVDLDSKKETDYQYDADKLIGLLPTSSELDYGEPAFPEITYQDKNGNFCGYQPSIIHEFNTSRKEYQELKRFTDKLVKDCGTDLEKIKAISNWVNNNMAYRLGSLSGNSIESVYGLFRRLSGNCMCFTQLTNYMLYLEGIPCASIIVPGHEMGAAFDGKKWYVVDSTNGYIGTGMDEGSGVIETIVFTSGQLTFDIRSTDGIYLGAVGYNQTDQKTIHSITIPSYVKGIYDDVLSYLPKDVVVKGERGGQVEAYCKKIYKYITYSGNQFSATNASGSGEGGSPGKDENNVKLGTKVTKNNITYKVTGKASAQKPGTVSCIGSGNDLKGTVKIPASIKMKGYSYQVTAIAAKAFQDRRKITAVTLPSRIHTIGSYAFAGCSKLKRLAIPAQVAKIGAYAFQSDKNLKSITIESGKLTKKNVKKSLAGSSLKSIRLSQAAKNKKASYRKIFTATNSGRKVTVQ